MKAYKRQTMAMFTLLAGIGMVGSVFGADVSSIHANDIVHKPVVTKMQKDTASTTGNISLKKHKKISHKKINHMTESSAHLGKQKEMKKKDAKSGTLNPDKMIDTVNSTTTSR